MGFPWMQYSVFKHVYLRKQFYTFRYDQTFRKWINSNQIHKSFFSPQAVHFNYICSLIALSVYTDWAAYSLIDKTLHSVESQKNSLLHVLSLPVPDLRYNWILPRVSLSCEICWLETLTYSKMITEATVLTNTSVTSLNYHFFLMVRTFKTQSLSNTQV